MKGYEIKITPLEGGKEPPASFVCDAYVLGTLSNDSTISGDCRGSSLSTFVALSGLVSEMMEDYPKETAAALEVALEHVKREQRKSVMN